MPDPTTTAPGAAAQINLKAETATRETLAAAVSKLALQPAVQLPAAFKITEVPIAAGLHLTPIGALVPSLGPLVAFNGTFTGNGFNTIFRPDSPVTPTPLPAPVTGSDNVLELNLTAETLSFSAALGSVPNRGMVQADAFLNGVPYLQAINDVTNPAQPTGIHLEPGLWICVPPTTDPREGQEVARMASIPHGTTICAQGTSSTISGPPTIPPVDITPFQGATKFPFPSQTATNHGTARIPQDLTPFIAAGTITQAMLTDPNTVLRNHIAGQHITSTTIINISTAPASPLFGGGTDNIAFLMGDATASRPNAQTTRMTATFWIETVQHTILVPIFTPGQPPLLLAPEGPAAPGAPQPKFIVHPPGPIPTPRPITVTSTQIQYSQTVFLNFNGLTWPHVSVATLTPSGGVTVPPGAWA
ncbi:MAG TPA: heme-binding protein [Caulobacteraceae bacterium]|nr:heme-binding protein [Caulobacteraceae bacterium]